MPATIPMPTPESVALRPQFFRLPKPGVPDPHFGFSRAFFYAAEKRGWLKMIRIRDEGKDRGITLIPYKAVEEFLRAQIEVEEKRDRKSERTRQRRVKTTK